MSFNLTQIVNKEIPVSIMNRSSIKQPVGFLNDWKKLANGVAQYSMYVGYDNILYFTRAGKEWKMADITDDATLVEGRVLSDNPRYSVRFPDKFIQVYNVTVGDTTNIEVRKKINFEDVPEVIHTFEGVRTNRLSCSSHYDGINEFIFIGEYVSAGHNFPARMWFSKDGGVTFDNIKDTSFVDTASNSHWHTGVFDPYQGRIWVSEGDGADNRGVHFSDDYGETWTRIDSQLYQPTLIVPFSEKVFFGRDSNPSPGFDVYVKPKKQIDFDTAPVFQDALTFLPNEPSYAYYPSGNYARNNNEVYVSFNHKLGAPHKSYIYATGDCGESWHCVYSSLFPIGELMYKDGYVIGHTNSANGSGLYFTKSLDWV